MHRTDRALARAIDVSNCWNWEVNNLAENIYTNPQKLAAKEATLLYFQPPVTYKPREPYVLTQAQFAKILGLAENEIMTMEA
jgi:hypothetical protein